MGTVCTPQEIKVPVIFGPTASGKTALAKAFFSIQSPFFTSGKAEIISADSMQVYVGMDIGTAKPSRQLLQELPHHLIDLFSPDCQFTAGEFVRRADRACAEISNRGKVPVVLGGTAFYIRNFLFGLPKTPQADLETRNYLKNAMKIQGAEALHAYLAQLDPESAVRIHVNDEYRILRALEVCVASGKPLASFKLPQKIRKPYSILSIGLDCSRETLYTHIDQRVDAMFETGLPEEVCQLRKKGYGPEDPGMQAIGYREFFLSSDIEAVKQLIKVNTKKYAKRQMTFFKAIPEVQWFDYRDIQGIFHALEPFFK